MSYTRLLFIGSSIRRRCRWNIFVGHFQLSIYHVWSIPWIRLMWLHVIWGFLRCASSLYLAWLLWRICLQSSRLSLHLRLFLCFRAVVHPIKCHCETYPRLILPRHNHLRRFLFLRSLLLILEVSPRVLYHYLRDSRNRLRILYFMFCLNCALVSTITDLLLSSRSLLVSGISSINNRSHYNWITDSLFLTVSVHVHYSLSFLDYYALYWC